MTLTRDTWQVGVYAPGGHYLPHYDDFDVLDPQAVTGAGVWVGNRLATAMAYLSEVQGGLEAGTLTIRTLREGSFAALLIFYLSGGFTAFPNVGVAARPRPGSVVFWASLDSAGGRDHRGLHGACPR